MLYMLRLLVVRQILKKSNCEIQIYISKNNIIQTILYGDDDDNADDGGDVDLVHCEFHEEISEG